MIRKHTIAAALAVLLVGSTVAAVATPDIPEGRQLDVIVSANYIGPAHNGQAPDNPKGIVWTLEADGSSQILWASSADRLEEGETARWVGTLTPDELADAETYLQEGGYIEDPLAAEADTIEPDTTLASAPILCNTWADRPNWDHEDDKMEGSANQVCTGSWWKHRVEGQLQRYWGWSIWLREARAITDWEYNASDINAYVYKHCLNDNETDWRTYARGWVVALDGRESVRVDKEYLYDVECGV